MKYLVPLYLWQYDSEYRVYSTVDPTKIRRDEDGDTGSSVRSAGWKEALSVLQDFAARPCRFCYICIKNALGKAGAKGDKSDYRGGAHRERGKIR
jgi:hypothetical protein